jgi:transglycosylase-like protein with SLT domain
MADYRQLARQAAQRHGLNPDIFERQIASESGFNPRARSPAGALGIAQIMPATARGWGVDPLNVRAALDAAAANMARYVKQTGSYENALRAYNAGPGNIERSKGFSETNAYVKKILGGAKPSTAGVSSGGGGGSTRTTTTTTTPGVDNRAARAALVSSFLEDAKADPGDFALQARGLQDVAPTRSTRTVTSGGGGGAPSAAGGGASVSGGKSPLLELIHKTPTGPGYAVKDGKTVSGPGVYGAVWDGHADHVHVAAGPNTVVKLGKLAQKMGLRVGENPHFGGVSPVHVPGSYHYKGEAIDVSGDPHRMDAYAAAVEHLYGLKR